VWRKNSFFSTAKHGNFRCRKYVKLLFYYEPRLPFVFCGALLKNAIEKPIAGGLKRLAARYDT